MSTNYNNLIAVAGLGFSFLGGNAVATELFSDHFPGASLNTDKWVRVAFTDVASSVSGGRLSLPITGWHHFNGVRTHDSFDFQEETIGVTVEIVSNTEPTWGTGDSMSTNLWFAFGPATTRDHLRNEDPEVAGIGFSIRRQSGDRLDLFSTVLPVTGTEISGIPSVVTFEVSATEYWITLTGATFTSGDFAGGNVLTGEHSIGPFESSSFTLLQELRGFLGSATSVIESVVVTTDAVQPPPTEWAHYDILEDGWVDTENWLGFLCVGLAPWIYWELMDQWIYLPEENVFLNGAWLFSTR